RAVAGDLGHDPGAAGLRVLEVFEDEHHRPLAHDKSVAAEVEGTASLLRLVVALARRLDLAESTHRQRRDGCFRATGKHGYGVATLYDLRRLADAVSAGCAGADDGVIGPAGLSVNGDDAGRHVGDHHRHRERAYPLGPALQQRGVTFLDLLHAADARAHNHADVVRVHLGGVEARLRQRLLGSRERELAVAADVAGGLAIHVVLGVEALDLGRDLGVEVGGVKAGDAADSGDAL